MNMITDPTRPRGILNERERRYLMGTADIEPRSQTERDIRATIRNRFRHAIYDWALLFSHLDDRDMEQVVDPRAETVADLRTAFEDALGLFYRATVDFHPPFHQLAQEGIRRAEETYFDRYVNVTLDVEPTAPVDLSELRAKMEQQRAQGLTPEEAVWIAETVIESEEFAFTDLDAAHEEVRRHQAGIDTDSETDETADRSSE